MKNLLLKHGILPRLLSGSDMKLFEDLVTAAKSGDSSKFENFISSFNQSLSDSSQLSKQIKAELLTLAEKVEDLLEGNSVSADSSLLSAFRAPDLDGNAESKHNLMLIAISNLLSSLSELKSKCAELFFELPLTELKLGEIAVAEYLSDDLLNEYRLSASRAGEYYEKSKAEASRLIELANAIEVELTTLCVSSDKAFRSSQSYADYHRIIRNSMGNLHSLILKIKEL